MEIQFKFELDDFLKAKPSRYTMKYIVHLIGFFTFCLLSPYMLVICIFSLISKFSLLYVFYTGIYICFLYFWIFRNLREAKKAYNLNKDIVYTFLFTDDGIVINSDEVNYEYKWTVFKEFFENKDCIYIRYEKTRRILIIPKRCFDSEERLIEFRELLNSKNIDNNYEINNNIQKKVLKFFINLKSNIIVDIIVITTVVLFSIFKYL